MGGVVPCLMVLGGEGVGDGWVGLYRDCSRVLGGEGVGEWWVGL